MAQPTACTVEIEFTPSVWTDVTTYVDWTTPGQTRFGRQTPFSAAPPGTLTLTLDNSDGRFTPGRQVLADGTTAHPYYPNVVPRKRIRVAWVVGSPLYRFTGYIKGFPPSMMNGDTPRVQITASTRDDRLSRVQMQPVLTQEVTVDAPMAYWPLTDAAGSTSAAELSGNGLASLARSSVGPTFGNPGPGDGDGTAATFTGAGGNPQGLTARRATSNTPVMSIEAWVQISAVGASDAVGFVNPAGTNSSVMGTDAAGKAAYVVGGMATGPLIADGGWHQLVVVWDVPTVGKVSLYCDGALVGSATDSVNSAALYSITVGSAGLSGAATSPWVGSIGQVACYSQQLSAARILAHFSAGRAWVGETTDARIKRFLGYAGLTSSDWNIDASTVTLSSYEQGGKDVVTACQDMTVSEGGGSVFYVGTDGLARFCNRKFRKAAAPVLTVAIEGDDDYQSFQPIFDDTQIINQVQGSRGTASTTASTQTVNDLTSQAAYGITSSSFTSFAQTDDDVRFNAQDQLAKQRQPIYQFGQLAVDLTTATTAGMYASVAGTDIGERIRVTNLPPGAAPVTQVDVLCEGWSDTFSDQGITTVFDTSPADSPAGGIFDDNVYGRWACDGQTLNATSLAASTTVVIATPVGKPTMTTAAVYPFKITVGAERIQLNSPPGGATSPQTFTGCTRGVDGTTRADQAAGSPVQLSPADTYTL